MFDFIFDFNSPDSILGVLIQANSFNCRVLHSSSPDKMAAVAANPAPTLENKVKPAKPDESAFKSDLAAAEKEHAAVQEKLVCASCVDRLRFCLCSHNWLSFYFLFPLFACLLQ